MLHANFDCRLYLIRHGESRVNTRPQLIGGRSPRTPLTDRGREQAGLLGERLAAEQIAFDMIFTSTLRRARQTAEIVARKTGLSPSRVRPVPELVEFSQGDWERKPRNEVYTPETLARINLKANDFIPPGGESHRMVERRASGWLERTILWNAAFIRKHPVAHVGVVAHGITLKCLLHYALGFSGHLIWRIALDNCSLSVLRFNRHGWHLESINDSWHVRSRTGSIRLDPLRGV